MGILEDKGLFLKCLIVFASAFVITLIGYWGLRRTKITSKLFLGK